MGGLDKWPFYLSSRRRPHQSLLKMARAACHLILEGCRGTSCHSEYQRRWPPWFASFHLNLLPLAYTSSYLLKRKKHTNKLSFLCGSPVPTLTTSRTLLLRAITRDAITPANLSFIKIRQDPHSAVTAQMRSKVQQWANDMLKLTAVLLLLLTLGQKTHASCMVLE